MSFLESQTIKSTNTNFHYRRALQQNAKSIIKTNSNQAFIQLGTSPYNNNQMIDYKINTIHNPYIYKHSYDNTELPTCIPNSQMKKNFLEKKQIQLRMVSPSISINNIRI